MTLLAVDIGNSHTVLGIFRGESLIGEWRMGTYPLLPVRTLEAHLRLFCREVGARPEEIGGAGIASVVPVSAARFVRLLQKNFSIQPLLITRKSPAGMRIRYNPGDTLGADRICNAVAAYTRYGSPVVVIDFGTATTFDIVSKNGTFEGGIIFPGIETLANSLHHFTAQLPVPPLTFPRRVAGGGTISCLQSGIMYGTADAMEGLIRRLKKEIGGRVKIVATGGYASLLAPHIPSIDTVDHSLVLEGIRLIQAKVSKRRSAGNRLR